MKIKLHLLVTSCLISLQYLPISAVTHIGNTNSIKHNDAQNREPKSKIPGDHPKARTTTDYKPILHSPGHINNQETDTPHKRVQYLQLPDSIFSPAERPPVDGLRPNPFTSLLLDNDTFVDKSLLMKDLLSEPVEFGADTTTIIRHRRTGKSINLSMLQSFLEIEVDENGNLLPKRRQINRKLFTGGTITVDGHTLVLRKLKVAEHRNIMRHQGLYPVILLNFTQVIGDTYQEVENAIEAELYNALLQHSYLQNHYNTWDSGNIAYKNIKLDVDFLFARKNNTYENIIENFKTFIEVLKEHHKQRVCVLIDEYERPIINAYLRFGKDKPEEFDKVHALLQDIMGQALNGNIHVERGIVVGSLPILMVDIRGGVNNVDRYTILEDKFSSFFGFTTQELDQLLASIPTTVHPSQVKHFYNGYNCGNEILYNSHSIKQCLARGGKLEYHWLVGDSTDLLTGTVLSAKEIKADLPELLNTPSIVRGISEHIEFVDLEILCSSTLYGILIFGGYVNAILADDSIPVWRTYHLMIPNEELRIMIATWDSKTNPQN